MRRSSSLVWSRRSFSSQSSISSQSFKHLNVEVRGGGTRARSSIGVVSLNRAPVNALSTEVIRELRDVFKAANEDASLGGLVLTSAVPNVLSAGLDLPSLLALDRAGMKEFFSVFLESLWQLSRLPLFTATAVTGHAPAGGCVYAIMTDYRVMSNASAAFRIGLNETAVGVIIPRAIHEHFAHIVGPRRADLMALSGAMVSPEEALKVGLVDELVPSGEEATSRCIAKVESVLSGVVFEAFSESKKAIKKHRADLLLQDGRDDAWIDHFFSEPIQRALKATVEAMKKKKTSTKV